AGIGDTYQLRQYTLRVDDLGTVEGKNYSAQRATVGVFENNKKVAVFHPERRFYEGPEGQQPTTEVALWERAKEDGSLVFAVSSQDGKRAVFQVYPNPLTVWVWVGGWVLVLGTLIALLPNKKSSPARRQKETRRVEQDADVEQAV